MDMRICYSGLQAVVQQWLSPNRKSKMPTVVQPTSLIVSHLIINSKDVLSNASEARKSLLLPYLFYPLPPEGIVHLERIFPPQKIWIQERSSQINRFN